MKTLLVALNAQYMHVNLALRQILCGLDGKDAQLYEAHINLPYRQILESIGRFAPDAVGFSTYIWNAPLAWRLCRALKQALPGVILFAGGPQAQSDPEAAFAACPALDYVLTGEGERVVGPFLRALDRGLDPAALPGVCCLRAGKLSCSPPPAPMPPEQWPDAWGEGRLAGLENRILYTETSRGCPYRCAYCLSAGAGAVRALPADAAIARLTAMAEGGAQLIKLVDRTFNFDKKRAAAIWQGLIDHSDRTGCRPRYHFEIGAHLLDDGAFAVLAQAPYGLFQFEAGIQSTDPEVLDGVGRGVYYEQLAGPLKRVMALQTVPLHTDLIAALPGESLHTFDQAYAIGAQQLQLGFLKVLPGSPLGVNAQALGIKYEPDPPYEALSTPQISFSQLCFLKDVEEVVNWYHNSGRYPLTLKYLLEGRAPFALFGDMAKRLRQMGALDAQRRERDRAGYLLALYGDDALGDLLAHDLLSQGLGAELPAAIDRREDEELRFLLRQRYKKVRGQRAWRHGYDVLSYAKGGPLQKKEIIAFYS